MYVVLGLDPGHYIFQFIIKKNTSPAKYYFDTLQVLRVSIRTVEESLPSLDFAVPGDLFFIKPEEEDTMGVSLDLNIEGSVLFDILDLCMEVKRWM